MADRDNAHTGPKRCFVTVGATAAFNSLVEAVLKPSFLEALRFAKFTELRIQYGDDGRRIFDIAAQIKQADIKDLFGIEVSGFDFNKSGLEEEMRAAKGISAETEGCVISHAGSGSILDALRIAVPLIVVPNTDLLHNHQVEIAEVLAEQNYVIHGKIDNLAEAITEVEKLRRRMRQWPPINSGEEKYPQGLGSVMAEEMGWVD